MHNITIMDKSGSFLGRIISLPLVFLLSWGPIASHGAAETLEIKTVISDGLGTDVPSAAQNAAQNALTNVVGSFIDATKLLEKRTEIQEGVRSATSRIDTNIKEYSQGSIQGFEVLEVSSQGGLTKVTAKVSVRLENFKNYIKKLAEGEVAVAGESLFAQAATETKQMDNKSALLYENVILPISYGQVFNFTIEPPQPAKSYKIDQRDQSFTQRAFNTLIQQYGIENVFIFKLTVSLKPEFEENMKKTLSNISSNQKKVISGMGSAYNRVLFASLNLPGERLPVDDVIIAILNYQSAVKSDDVLNKGVKLDAYYIQNVKQKLNAVADPSLHLFKNMLHEQLYIPDLEVSLLDANEISLQSFLFKPVTIMNASRFMGIFTDAMGDRGFIAEPPKWTNRNFAPWALLQYVSASPHGEYFAIYDQKSIDLVLAIEPTALAKTKKIRVNLVK